MTTPASGPERTIAERAIDREKQDARSRAIAVRDAIDVARRQAGAARIAEIGLAFTGLPPPLTVSAYAAIGSELDPALLLQAAARIGFVTCLPVIQPRGQPLRFRQWNPGDPLAERMWGISEPLALAREIDPDILLVPLLAFDASGLRLGYGGGYYDRTIARLRALKPIVAIGVAFDEQESAQVPAEAHDERLDWVLTPAGARRKQT